VLRRWIRFGRVFVVLLALGSRASFGAGETAEPEGDTSKATITIPPGSGVLKEVIGCEAEDGSIHLAAVAPAEMPWRVAIGMPKNSPQYGSRQDGRNAAIAGMRHWERAIQSKFPWFELEFVMKDRDAPVQIKWRRRTTGSAQGRAGPVCWTDGGRIRAGGAMEVAVEACPTCSRLTVDEIELLLAHEFGHILGLGHCLDCDSAMNYSWQTEGRIHVTQVDVDAVVRRFGMADERAGTLEMAGTSTGPTADPKRPDSESLDAEEMVELAKSTPAVHASQWSCKEPFLLKRSCSKASGPKKKKEIGGIDVRVAGTKDGTVLLVTPVEFGLLTEWPARDRYFAVVEAAEEKGLTAVSATAMVAEGIVLGYWIKFDGDAWSALGL